MSLKQYSVMLSPRPAKQGEGEASLLAARIVWNPIEILHPVPAMGGDRIQDDSVYFVWRTAWDPA